MPGVSILVAKPGANLIPQKLGERLKIVPWLVRDRKQTRGGGGGEMEVDCGTGPGSPFGVMRMFRNTIVVRIASEGSVCHRILGLIVNMAQFMCILPH